MDKTTEAQAIKELAKFGIVYENKHFWVYDGKEGYTVYRAGITHSAPISTFKHDRDGLSLAKAYCDYKAKTVPFNDYPQYTRTIAL